MLNNINGLYKRVIGNTSIGLAGSGVSLVTSILKTALLTKIFNIYDYGLLMIVVNFYNFFNNFLSVKINDFLFRHLPELRKKDKNAESGLIVLSIIITVIISLVIFLLVIVFNGLVDKFYSDHLVAELIIFYVLGGVLHPFLGFSQGILRLKNKFTQVVIPQAAFSIVTVLFLYYYLVILGMKDLHIVSLILGSGAGLSYFVPFCLSVFVLKKDKISFSVKKLKFLREHKQELKKTLIQTNIAGYLKVGSSNGVIFMLGALGTPTQVALFNLANQLLKPIKLLQNNLQPAIFPEIVKLHNEKRHGRLVSLIKKMTVTNLIIGLSICGIIYPFIDELLLLISTEKYLPSVPVFLVIIVTATVQFAFFCFYPLAVVTDKLRKRNVIILIGFVITISFTIYQPTAIMVAYAQLLGVLLTRVFNDIPLFLNTRQLSNSTNV